MELLPAPLQVDISGLVWSGDAAPTQQLVDYASRATGRRVQAREIVLSRADGFEVELRTRDFIFGKIGATEAAVAWIQWQRNRRPRVSLKLARGVAEIEARGAVA